MKREQLDFWQGDFGTSYISRNESQELLASNLNFFSEIFSRAQFSPTSFIEYWDECSSPKASVPK